jgi:hypothetical protein
VHDYAGVSLWGGRDKTSKEAATKASQIFSDYYPELLSSKWFVNVNFCCSLSFPPWDLLLIDHLPGPHGLDLDLQRFQAYPSSTYNQQSE